MDRLVRRHTGAVSALLSAVSLALVVAAVRGYVPSALLPRAPDAALAAIPTLNALLSAVAIVAIVAGVRAIRGGDVAVHRRRMLAAFGLFVTFLLLYLYRLSLVGPTHFSGPGWVEQFVYLPILGVHMGLAIVCIPLLYYVLLLAYAHPVAALAETRHRPVAVLSDTRHPTVGRVAAALWLVSFAMGIVVYLLLYHAFPS